MQMKKVWLYLSAVFEDTPGACQLIPIFAGVVLVFVSIKVSDWTEGSKYHDVLSTILCAIAFTLWGIQGMIFAVHQEFPVIIPPLRGKPAVLLGIVCAVVCFVVVARLIFVQFLR